MGRFASTVPFYERARQPYGSGFFASVAKRLNFAPNDRLLDLGTGPGLLALGFAPFVCTIVGVDPEPAMLAAARHNAATRGVALRLIEGKAETLPRDIGTFDIVTIGRALHWMDPGPTRDALRRVASAGGVILVCSSSTASDDRNPWLTAYEALRKRFSEEAGVVRYRERDAFFAASPFALAETITVETEHRVAVDHLADRILSMSSSSPDTIGEVIDLMRAAVHDTLAPFATDGVIREVVEARAEVFRRL
jgi:SAM-dependent methyltransferase